MTKKRKKCFIEESDDDESPGGEGVGKPVTISTMINIVSQSNDGNENLIQNEPSDTILKENFSSNACDLEEVGTTEQTTASILGKNGDDTVGKSKTSLNDYSHEDDEDTVRTSKKRKKCSVEDIDDDDC